MSIYSVAATFEGKLKRVGYKIVAWDGKSAWSLYQSSLPVSLESGKEESFSEGLYLGTSRQFVIDYYTGLTDMEDLLLTYEFNLSDVVNGDPDYDNGEVVVSNATLLKVENIRP